jgi:hypothetical protein
MARKVEEMLLHDKYRGDEEQCRACTPSYQSTVVDACIASRIPAAVSARQPRQEHLRLFTGPPQPRSLQLDVYHQKGRAAQDLGAFSLHASSQLVDDAAVPSRSRWCPMLLPCSRHCCPMFPRSATPSRGVASALSVSASSSSLRADPLHLGSGEQDAQRAGAWPIAAGCSSILRLGAQWCATRSMRSALTDVPHRARWLWLSESRRAPSAATGSVSWLRPACVVRHAAQLRHSSVRVLISLNVHCSTTCIVSSHEPHLQGLVAPRPPVPGR